MNRWSSPRSSLFAYKTRGLRCVGGTSSNSVYWMNSSVGWTDPHLHVESKRCVLLQNESCAPQIAKTKGFDVHRICARFQLDGVRSILPSLRRVLAGLVPKSERCIRNSRVSDVQHHTFDFRGRVCLRPGGQRNKKQKRDTPSSAFSLHNLEYRSEIRGAIVADSLAEDKRISS